MLRDNWGAHMQWTKLLINWLLGWVPDLLIAYAYMRIVEGGSQEFWIAFLALQALYFALWLKRAIWALLLYFLYNRFVLAKTLEKFFSDNKFPRPEMWVGSADDYFDQILMDDTIEAEMKIKAAFEKGSLNGLKIAQQNSLVMMMMMASKRAINRYARYALERPLEEAG